MFVFNVVFNDILQQQQLQLNTYFSPLPIKGTVTRNSFIPKIGEENNI